MRYINIEKFINKSFILHTLFSFFFLSFVFFFLCKKICIFSRLLSFSMDMPSICRLRKFHYYLNTTENFHDLFIHTLKVMAIFTSNILNHNVRNPQKKNENPQFLHSHACTCVCMCHYQRNSFNKIYYFDKVLIISIHIVALPLHMDILGPKFNTLHFFKV